MKKVALLLLPVVLIILVACTKTPVASFKSDKDEYYSGDVIHLVNTSENVDSWTWTGPDGKTYTTKDLDYPLSSSVIRQELSFTLHVQSKSGKAVSVTKKIKVKQFIPSTDFFSYGSTIITPTRVFSLTEYSTYSNWTLYADNDIQFNGSQPTNNATNLYIYFYGSLVPTAGTYTLTSNQYSLTTGYAHIRLTTPNSYSTHFSYSGSLDVSNTTDGKLRIKFNNIPTNSSSISGDIIYP